jgi:hypothetical protein
LLDSVLAGLLIVALPAYMIVRSVVRRKGAADNLLGRYLQTILIALTLVAALLIDWLQSGRPAAALGLTLPVSGVGMAGLAIACAVLIELFVAVRRQLKSNPGAASKLPDGMPQTSRQLAVFIVFAVVVGCSWEAL